MAWKHIAVSKGSKNNLIFGVEQWAPLFKKNYCLFFLALRKTQVQLQIETQHFQHSSCLYTRKCVFCPKPFQNTKNIGVSITKSPKAIPSSLTMPKAPELFESKTKLYQRSVGQPCLCLVNLPPPVLYPPEK